MKLGEGWTRSLYQLLKLYLYDRTSEIHLMAVHYVAAERGGLIKKERKRKFMGKAEGLPTY